MAIVEYQCDTCKRTIELQRNVKGLEIVGRCIITHGCRGSLYQTKLHPDYIRGSIPDPVIGLDDWKQRKVLYNHTQSIERSEWIIEHNMGIIPTVSVFVNRPIQNNINNKEKIIPTDIIIESDNVLILKFDKPWSGIAQLVSKQSDPNLLQPTIRTVSKETVPIQISNLGEISIATRFSVDNGAPLILLKVEYTSTLETTFLESYSVDNQPSINSAWQDPAYNKIAININLNRQAFTTRSFNGITPAMSSGEVESGNTFKFTQIDPTGTGTNWKDIEEGDVVILLASSPYDIVDKILNQYIDVYNVSDTVNPFGFYYNNGEFYTTTETVTSVFPPILNIDN